MSTPIRKTSNFVAAIKRLELFNEKAAKLERSRLLQRMSRSGVAYQVRFGQRRKTRAWHNAPKGESVDAFVLTYRWFIQDRDGISLRAIAKLYRQLPISRELRKDVAAARRGIRKYLSQRTKILIKNHTPTRGEVCDTFLYGELSHANADKRAKFEHWQRGPVTFMMLDAEFVRTLARVASIILFMRDTNRKAITELQTASIRMGTNP